MSRPRYYWYGSVKKMISRYTILAQESSLQSAIFQKAIDISLEETKKLPNGEERVKAIEIILIKQTKTAEGVALEMNYSWRTIQNWITSFVNMVGRNAGF